MTEIDLLILVIYLICVFYVINRAINSLDARFTVQVNQAGIAQQIQDQGIQDSVSLLIPLAGRYTKPDQLQTLTLILNNRSSQQSIYVDWDHSSLTDFGTRSRRVIRLLSGMSPDLFQPQVLSVVAPGKTLQETFTAEDVLKGDSDSGSVKVAAPLVNLAQVKAPAEPKEFTLRLILRLFDPVSGNDRIHIIYCQFVAKRLPWTDALPWKHLKP